MRLTQGTFSYLADLTDAEIAAQVRYCLDRGWAVNIEHTDDPHPRNVYWDMWELPYFDQPEPSGIMLAIEQCRMAFPDHYIRVNGYDRSYCRQTTALSFIVQRPAEEPGFRLVRQEGTDRQIRYTLQPYAADKPAGQRYKTNGNGRGHNGSGWQFAAHPESMD